MVNGKLEGGRHLIDALRAKDCGIEVAFWVKESDEEKWFLYLASPCVDEKGPGEAYRLIHAILHHAPEWGIDPFEVMVVGSGNPMAQAAVTMVKSKMYLGITRLGRSVLGRVSVDGAYVYPSPQPASAP